MVDATGYTVNATSTSGHKASCSSATAACTLTGLMCSETYTATITAKGSYCDSAPSPGTNITTRKCAGSSVSSASTALHLVNCHLLLCPLSSALSSINHIETIHVRQQLSGGQVD